ncbi:MAG: sigma-54-dependent Fis family transcriptional regulator [Hyphomicrobium sp.]|jgi:transcriptional regulator of acetoin/glycerol metabolism
MDGMEYEKAGQSGSREYVHTKKIFDEIARDGSRAGQGDSLVVSSWKRCVTQHKLDPNRHSGPEIVTQPELKTASDALDMLTHVAKPDIARLMNRLASANYVIMLSDANGIALDVLSSAPADRALRRVGVCAGAAWGEENAGTNGIGTSIAAGCGVTVHRSQHFFPAYLGLTCTAAPIFDAAGNVIAALDASAVADLPQEMQFFVLDLLVETTRCIERRYFLKRNKDRHILRIEWGLDCAVKGNGAMIALDDNGAPVEILGGTTEHRLPERAALIGKPLSGFLDINWQDGSPQKDGESVERIGIARVKGSDRPCFASLIAPAGRPSPLRASKQPAQSSTQRAPVAAQGNWLGLEALAGRDPTMLEHLRTIKQLVDKRLPILLHGETGTGKEEFARGIHLAGARANGPFVAIDCSSIPESLIESELFGYETGTFTGARREGRKGRIAEANGGTLFLDEIGDMPLQLQTRLLRVLAQSEVVPLGSTKPTKVDFNVICASHQDLPKLVSDGRFRQDLYYRIAGIRLELPPLRARADKADVILSALAIEAAHMGLDNPPRLSPKALQILVAQPWAGNMRELRLAMRYALACADRDEIEHTRLPTWLDLNAGDGASPVAGEEVIAPDLVDVLERNGWCISDAASELSVSRQTLYRWIKKLEINRPT